MLSSVGEIDVLPWTRLFRALADETRVRIVALLSHGELCVCHVETALDLPQPTASRHLGILRQAGLIVGRRDGSWMYYGLAPQEHAGVQAVIDDVVRSFAGQRLLRADLARLKKSCGPGACP